MDFAKLGPMRLVLAAMIIVSSGLAAGDDSQFNGRSGIFPSTETRREGARGGWRSPEPVPITLRGKFIGAPGGRIGRDPQVVDSGRGAAIRFR